MTDPQMSRADAVRARLIARVEADLQHRQVVASDRAERRKRLVSNGSPRWAVLVAVLLVGGLAGAVSFAAFGNRAEVAGVPTESAVTTPTPSPTPGPVYPELPAVDIPLTAEGLGTCRFRAGIFAMGRLAIESGGGNLSQTAYNDLAEYMLADAPDQIAATGGGHGTVGLQIVPAAEGVDIPAIFDRAVVRLIPEFQPLVSLDAITVAEPIGYSFEDVCRAYLDATYLADQAGPGSDYASPWFSLSLSPFDATVSLEVPHDVPDAVREMQEKYGRIVQVTVMPEGYEGMSLW